MGKLSPRGTVRYIKCYMVNCGDSSRTVAPCLCVPFLVFFPRKKLPSKEQQQQGGGTLCRKWSAQLSPGWVGPLRGSITTTLNSFFIRVEPLRDGAPPVTWAQSWRIGFRREWEICNQGNHLSFFLPRNSVPFSYRTGSLSWAILISFSKNSLIQGRFYNFQTVAGSWDFAQQA